MRLTGIVGVCSDVAYRPFISRAVVETSTDQSDRERLWCDINDLRHVEVDGGRQQQVHLLTWHLGHGGNHIDGVFDALR